MIQKVKNWKVTEENGAQFEMLVTYTGDDIVTARRLSDGKIFHLRDYVWNTKTGIEDFKYDRIILFWPDMTYVTFGNRSRSRVFPINELSKLKNYETIEIPDDEE